MLINIKNDGFLKMSKFLQAIADKRRLEILCVIFSRKKICVTDIAKMMGMSVAIASHHLKILAENGLLHPIRDGKMTCYVFSKNVFVKDLKRLICKYKLSKINIK